MSLTRKLQSVEGLTTDQIKCLARHMPRDAVALASVMNGTTLPDSKCDRVLEITRAHVRDQTRFEECLSHVRAFASGGLYGIQRLNEVIDVILKHFGMEKEKWELLTSADVSMDFQTGRLRARKQRCEEDEER